MRLTQAHPRTAAIPIDEFDAGGLQSTPNRWVIDRGHWRLSLSQLGPADRGDAERRRAGEIFSTPAKEGAGSSDLSTGQRL